jgi:predicted CoA-binding protein
MIDQRVIDEFLELDRIAIVGASDDVKSFGNTIYCALRDHGYRVVAVNPKYVTVAGDPCSSSLATIPGQVEGVMVMVPRERARDVVLDAYAAGASHVWLFKGLGAPGSNAPEAVEAAHRLGLQVVDGACPMMFLEPVGWFHRMHRVMSRKRFAQMA